MENVKQYAINKMIGRLDTKAEFQRLSKMERAQKEAEEQVKKRYANVKEVLMGQRLTCEEGQGISARERTGDVQILDAGIG